MKKRKEICAGSNAPARQLGGNSAFASFQKQLKLDHFSVIFRSYFGHISTALQRRI
jgi:hypothetical protein